jgi:hypothetical protein
MLCCVMGVHWVRLGQIKLSCVVLWAFIGLG